jgi:DTW domain-containing protein
MSLSIRAQEQDQRGFRPFCYRCLKPKVACICALVERVENKTGIVILQHPRERFHAIGTTRIARLGLANVRILPLAPWEDGAAVRARMPERMALLYPTPCARDLAGLPVDRQPRHLVIIDGTWFQAKKIYEAHPWLGELPCVSLTPSEPSRYRIRTEPGARYVATLEAIVYALRILEPQTCGLDRLLSCFAAMIDRQAAYNSG